MPEVIAVKTAGFVDRGSNYDRKRRRIEDEENLKWLIQLQMLL